MELSEISFAGPKPIDSYGPGFFRVGGMIHHGSLALLPDALNVWPGSIDFDFFLERIGQLDVLLVGSGAEISPLKTQITDKFNNLGVGIETMTTPSACRTYNMLLAEGRRIGAALIPI